MSSLTIEPITPAIGAEVRGVDLGTDLNDHAVVDTIREAFWRHHVLVFRNQHLDQDQHKAFGRLFGELHIHPSKRTLGAKGDPEIFTVKTDENTRNNNGGRWHMDVSCEAVPPLGSMLLLDVSPPSGGDTLFANMHLAYDRLSDPIKELVSSLSAYHDGLQDLRWYGYEPQPGASYPAHSHPVVVSHPVSGRPTLFVNEAFTSHIEGLMPLESDALLRMLFANISTTPSIQCRVRWEPGTLTFWDNRCTQHFAVWDYAPHPRRGERVTIAGTAPPAAIAAPRRVS